MHVENEDKPHLLIYAHYYYPDVASTGQILKELSEGLLRAFHVTVISAVPSYEGTVPKEYKSKKYFIEHLNGVNLVRVRVPEFTKAKKTSRIRNILCYFFRAIRATKKCGRVQYVFAISQPPILGGLLGVWGKWANHAKYLYNIQDFNPEQIQATGYSKNAAVLKLMLSLDKFSCRKSDKVIVVGRDMVKTLETRFSRVPVPTHAFINNWIDEKSIFPLSEDDPDVLKFREQHGLAGKFVIMYSGNIGLYYDLPQILRRVISHFREESEILFAFVGAGSVLTEMQKDAGDLHLKNVAFLPYQPKEKLIYSLNSGDVHWCINAKGIKGVSVPSKLYGIMAVGKPVMGVLEKGSEARLIMESSGCGMICEPGDYDEIEKRIRWFLEHRSDPALKEMGSNGRNYLENELTKEKSVHKYIEEITTC